MHGRPFDYFRIEGYASRTGLRELSTYGLLAGADDSVGRSGHAVWGLYGSYEYAAPAGFLFSATALSGGTTVQAWLSRSVAVQGTALAGVGYSAAQSVGGAGDRDYRYGLGPHAMARVRLIAGRRASLELAAREDLVGDASDLDAHRRDDVFRGDAAFTVRVYRQHALAVACVFSRRRSTGDGFPPRTGVRSTVGIFYSFLGSGGFGAVR